MSTTLKVYTTTPWLDHSEGRVWTVNDKWFTFINVVVGVSIGLVASRVERVVAHLLAWACYAVHLRQRRSDHAEEPQASAEDGTPSRNKRTWSTTGWAKWCTKVLVFVLGVAYAVAGTFVTRVPVDTAALSNSKTCGLWGLSDQARPAAQDVDALIRGEKETRAGQYARDCYGPQSAASLGQCSLFKKQNIPTSKVKLGQQCPFVNETYCPGTGYTAIKFTTGLVDAKSIGINAKNAPKFNRTMICVPLNMNPGFAEKISDQDGHWGYNFGPVSSDEYDSKYTFTQYGDPFTYDVRSYTMSTYVHVYSKAASQNYWQPIPALDIRPELNSKSTPYSLTLMFINSCRIFYKEDSADPIFPADRRWPRDPDLWINNDSRARPLACVDWSEVCTHEGTCTAPYQDNLDSDKNLVFTRYAMNKSTTFDAIEFRGAAGLDAQDKIKDDVSLPLAQDQWVSESWSLFNTSLSRIQYDALDIANGTNWDKAPLYNPIMPTWVQGQLCGIFTFQVPKGYDNVRCWPTLGILLIPIVFGWLGKKTKEDFGEQQMLSGYFGDGKLIVLEVLCRQTAHLFAWLWRKIASLWPWANDRHSTSSAEATDEANERNEGDAEHFGDAQPAGYGSMTR